MQKSFPTTRAQDTVLAALNITGVETYDAAQDLFKQLGISVTAVRKGRTSIPSVTILDSAVGGWTTYGDGDVYDVPRLRANLNALAEWVTNSDRLPKAPAPEVETPAIDGAAIQAAHEQERVAQIEQRYADEQRRKEQRRARFMANATLRQNGYTWHKLADDDDEDEWVLFTPDGHVATVEEALAAIAAK